MRCCIAKKRSAVRVCLESHFLISYAPIYPLPVWSSYAFSDYLCPEKREEISAPASERLFRHKERAGLFDETSSFDIRYSLTLGSISCISASLFIYDFFQDRTDLVSSHSSLYHFMRVHTLSASDHWNKDPLVAVHQLDFL